MKNERNEFILILHFNMDNKNCRIVLKEDDLVIHRGIFSNINESMSCNHRHIRCIKEIGDTNMIEYRYTIESK